ncbi:MAG: NAD(P)H-hydrate dehydratase [Thermoleophilia bacterium]|nr:NAD(P)H-hydrate dehydratase [Thermoleophilia bacterium]
MGPPLLTAGQMRRADAAAIRKCGIPGAVLMERAGMGVAEFLLENFCTHHCFVILAGKGNNGGDGFVVARHLLQAGAEVAVFAVARPSEYEGDALLNLKILGRTGLKVIHAPAAAKLRQALEKDCVIVDAVFGTGFSGEPRGKGAAFIEAAADAAEKHGAPVVAVDVASGVNASTGEIAETALPADATVTFHRPKVGHFVEPGGYFCGDLMLVDIGIPKLAEVSADHFLAGAAGLAGVIPPKLEYHHKFSVGRVLVAGGSTGMTGAACLTAESALRAGAGVVTCAVPETLNPIFEQMLLEVMTLPAADTGDGHLDREALPQLLEASTAADCVALGPGLGRRSATMSLAAGFLAESRQPVVLDADGLHSVSGKAGRLRRRHAPTVLSPHIGELGRLLGVPAAQVASHRLAHAREAARKTGSVVVLKGSATIVTDGRIVYVNPTGNPGLATAGAGDVLTGVIAALVAKDVNPLEAAVAAVYIHGTAADLFAEDAGRDNLIASDLIDYLPRAFAGIHEDFEGSREEYS